LLFEVFSQRYERGSIIVTSNLPFDEWTGVFASERLTGAQQSAALFRSDFNRAVLCLRKTPSGVRFWTVAGRVG